MALDVNPGETLEEFTKRAAEYYASCMAAAVAVVEAAVEAAPRSEQAPPDAFFANPRNERTRIFLGQILSH